MTMKRAQDRTSGWRSTALLAVMVMLAACKARPTAEDDLVAEAQAAAEAAAAMAADAMEDDALADTPADEAAEPVTGEEEAFDAAADTPDHSGGDRPATMSDVLQGLAALQETVDAVRRGDAPESQGAPAEAERRFAVWTEDEPPLTVEFQMQPLTEHMMSYRIIVRSRADRLEIHDVTLNRGNCGVAEVGAFDEGLKLPVALRYGQKKTINVRRCDKVLEATVDTQYGEYTFKWR